MNTLTDPPTLEARQRAAWTSGDYAAIGTSLQIVGERLAEACDLRWDERVLDVAAGNGNATLAAARRGCAVTSTDYAPFLLAHAAERARAERLQVTFDVADVEQLPFADASFDAVLSTFGVMFVPDQARAASELVRVCRAGGRIGLACWTPGGFIGQMQQILTRYTPSPADPAPPLQWGVESHVRTLFAAHAASISLTRRLFHFRYRNAAHFIEVFRAWHGSVHKAFAPLPGNLAMALESTLIALLHRFSRAGDRDLVVPSEYLEVVIRRAVPWL